jgi:hypothetical protein
VFNRLVQDSTTLPGDEIVVERFVDLDFDAEGTAVVLVKWADYDDPEWQPLDVIRSDMGKDVFAEMFKAVRRG